MKEVEINRSNAGQKAEKFVKTVTKLSASDYSSSGLHISGEIRAIEFDGGL